MSKANKVVSPLIPTSNCKFLGDFSVSEILLDYKLILPHVSAERLLGGIGKLSLYRCEESGYEFYEPFKTEGDDQYYAELSQLGWYYQDWKWEHEVALKHFKHNDKVLEVGAGSGSFLKGLIAHKSVDAIGLELNSKAEEFANQSGVKLINQTIQEFSKENSGKFDVVCSFQVLEHVAEVRSFIQSMVDCLKPGGTLIIGVPNNDSFIGRNRHTSRILNMPPHHMGRWKEASLSSLSEVFSLELIDFDKEPLQDLHFETFLYNHLLDRFKSKTILKVLYKFKLVDLFRRGVKKRQSEFLGHSINVYFRKP